MATFPTALARALLAAVLFTAFHSSALAQGNLPPPPGGAGLNPTQTELFPPGQPPGSPPVYPKVGAAVALDGHTALVGMPGYDNNLDIGRVAVFTRDASGVWARTGSIDPPERTPGLSFGVRIALDKDIALIGSANRVFVYERAHGKWNLRQEIKARGSEVLSGALGVEDESLLLGASTDGQPGVVHVFERNPHGDWRRSQDLHAFRRSEGDAFGESLAIARRTLVVGASGYKDGQGAAFVYQHFEHFYWPYARLEASDRRLGDGFGSAVATSGELIAVGAPSANLRSSNGCGAFAASGEAYVFARHHLKWAQQQIVLHPNSNCVALFAAEVAISPDYFVASTPSFFPDQNEGLLVYPRINGTYQARYFASTDVGTYVLSLQRDTLVAGNASERAQFPIGVARVYELGKPPAQ